jgi:hypothetical protein
MRRRACDTLLNAPLDKMRVARIKQGFDPDVFAKAEEPQEEKTATLMRKNTAPSEKDALSPFVLLSMRAHQAKAAFRFFEGDSKRPLLFVSFLALYEDPSLSSFADGVCMPPIITDRQTVLDKLKEWKKNGLRYAMTENIGHTPLALEAELIPYGGMRMNLTNRSACDFFIEQGGVGSILSPELKTAQARDIAYGVLPIYGHLPLMLTERCFIRENFGCAECDRAHFSDRMGVQFPLMREWEHRNVILNSRPTYMLDKRKEMLRAGLRGGALLFTCETEEETLETLDAFRRALPPKTEIKRIK